MISTDILLIASQVDEAGMNLARQVQELIEFVPVDFEVPGQWLEGEYQLFRSNSCQLLIMSTPHYQADYLQHGIEAELVIFLSKHISKAGQKAILVHSLGNWDTARHGSGQDYSLAMTSPKAMYLGYHHLLQAQQEDGLDNYWVGIEATHHGPTELKAPVLFVEIGGTEEEWQDTMACRTVAKAVVALVNGFGTTALDIPTGIGIGGTHYCRAFIDRIDQELCTISHVLPKYAIDGVDEKMIKQAWETTPADNKLFLIDKSGTKSAQRSKIEDILTSLDYPFSYTTDFSG